MESCNLYLRIELETFVAETEGFVVSDIDRFVSRCCVIL